MYKCPKCERVRPIRVYPYYCGCGHVAHDASDSLSVAGLAPATPPPCEVKPLPFYAIGPGTALKKRLAAWGYSDAPHDPSCNCAEMVAMMDAGGPQWCRQNRQIIISQLHQNAAALGWHHAILAKLGSGIMVDEAIADSEASAAPPRKPSIWDQYMLR